MAEVTVKKFAWVLGVRPAKLLAQLRAAGIECTGPDDTISEDAKLELLKYLRKALRDASDTEAVVCPQCRGSGLRRQKVCVVCDGLGRLEVPEARYSDEDRRRRDEDLRYTAWRSDIQRREEEELSVTSDREVCYVCNGDGGAAGQCYKCGGTGWIKSRRK